MHSVPDASGHLAAAEYEGFRAALQDAERVVQDLIDQVSGQVVVPAGEVVFLARRLRSLVGACTQAFDEEGS
jgi:hypothetical protein